MDTERLKLFVPLISESELKRVKTLLNQAEALCQEHVDNKDVLMDKIKQRRRRLVVSV